MDFLDRTKEWARLDRVAREGGLGVVWGRRRVGKTRLLVEWCAERGGTYVVADESSAPLQRRAFAEALSARFPAIADANTADWSALLRRVAAEAKANGWRGPLVLDELPYLVAAAPELPSALQRFIDHEAKDARLAVVVAGSSQRMMQGLVLDASAPLYGRARELIGIEPLTVSWLPDAFPRLSARDAIEHFAVWGGLPHHWDLAAGMRGAPLERALDALVLDANGPLHRAPDQLLMEEQPPATSLRPILDAIGLGAHRSSEIAGRVGQPATALVRPLARLVELGLVEREIPFGDSEKAQKRSLYKVRDPFFRMWFRVVAPRRSFLVAAHAAARIALWRKHRAALVAATWEQLARAAVPHLTTPLGLRRGTSLGVARRFWHGDGPEWDVVAADDGCALVAEVKWSDEPFTTARLEELAQSLRAKGAPASVGRAPVTWALFVPHAPRARAPAGVRVLTADDVLAALR